jgi:capsular exopolysaccharide synthesis family protein
MASKKSKYPGPIPLVTVTDKHGPASEKFRTIRSNIMFSSVDKEMKPLVVTSSGPNEGKSFTAANLAVVFADSGKKVLLVDADLRKPTVAITFKLPNIEGLSTLLTNRQDQPDSCIYQSGIDNLSILSSGPKPPNPSEMINSRRMEELLTELEQTYDLVIFDMPPVAAVTDAQILAARANGTLLVVRERHTKKQALLRAKNLLEMANANVIGVVYNDVKRTDENKYYYQE